jgi:hypothetical protein
MAKISFIRVTSTSATASEATVASAKPGGMAHSKISTPDMLTTPPAAE